MYLILAYIKFLFRSTNEHGVHSPFVFGLVTRCFYDKKKYPQYEIIDAYRKKLLSNDDRIKVTDFGAGSRVFSSEERKISAIAKNAGISRKRARLLNRLVRYLEVENALELGTSLGIGTAALAAGNDQTRITSIEGCPSTAAVAKKQFEEFGFDNIELKVGEFAAVLEGSGKRKEGRDNKVRSGKWREESGTYKEESEGHSDGADLRNDGADLQSVTSQPTTDNSEPTTQNPQLTPHTRKLTSEEKNSKSQIPKSKNSDGADLRNSGADLQSVTSQPTTQNPQLTPHNRKLTTEEKNSKSQIPTTNHKPPTTNNKQQTAYDLIFIDGNHRKGPTLAYFETLLPHVHNDSVMIFDDIHWSKEMEEAWEKIKAHPSVRVTIDTFYQGFVFFRREQVKEHFVIRV